MTSPALRVRPYAPKDRAALYRICLETGDSGADATALYHDPDLIGHVYAGPYGEFSPELAFVLEDAASGEVCGYVLGVLDTAAFEDTLERAWWPPLRERYPLPATPPEARSPDEKLIALIHARRRSDAALLHDFPSHLHIDLLARAQGGGHGRRLIDALLARLRELGSPGVHLGVGARNVNAIGFYQHLGFRTLEQHPWGRTMGYALRRPASMNEA